MHHFIEILSAEPQKDAQGFATQENTVLAKVRANKETRTGSAAWRNRAAFSTANALFRFRAIPGLTITTAMFIRCGEERFNIISADDVRGMYWSCLAEQILPSKG